MLADLVRQWWRRQISDRVPVASAKTNDALHELEAALSLQKTGGSRKQNQYTGKFCSINRGIPRPCNCSGTS
jgi:hypothetical protein